MARRPRTAAEATLIARRDQTARAYRQAVSRRSAPNEHPRSGSPGKCRRPLEAQLLDDKGLTDRARQPHAAPIGLIPSNLGFESRPSVKLGLLGTLLKVAQALPCWHLPEWDHCNARVAGAWILCARAFAITSDANSALSPEPIRLQIDPVANYCARFATRMLTARQHLQYWHPSSMRPCMERVAMRRNSRPTPVQAKKMPVAAYVRMSSNKQDTSPDQQRDHIATLAKRNNFEIVRWYEDLGISGDDIHRRAEFKRMISDASAGAFQKILCWSQDRFGRFDSIEAGEWVAPLRRAGVNLLTVADGEINWSDAIGRLIYPAFPR